MGKKWKEAEEDGAWNGNSGSSERYNAVHYVYDTRRLAKPTAVGVGKYSKAMELFRAGVKRNAKSAAACDASENQADSPPQNIDAEDSEIVNCEVDQFESEIKKKKKQKKKKKCTEKDTDEDGVEQTSVQNGDITVEEEIPAVSKKNKKKSKRETSPVQYEEPSDISSKSTKKIKKNIQNEESAQNPVYTISLDSNEMSNKKKKKKKKSKDMDSSCINDSVVESTNETVDNENTEGAEISKKKKKKKNKDKDKSCIDEQPNEAIDYSRKCEHLKNEQSELEPTSKKAKKKKKREHKDETVEQTLGNAVDDYDVNECLGDSESVNKKKKKKKSQENVNSDVCKANDNDVSQDSSPSKKKKKKKQKRGLEEEANTDEPSKKKKPNKPEPVSENGVSERAEESEERISAGQWSDVSLGDGARTNKFLRLMGGKNAKSVPTGAQSTAKFNQALDTEQSAKLDAALENQFVKAKQAILTKGKGVGLGFEKAPGEGKKFYIDSGKSKSVKFDD